MVIQQLTWLMGRILFYTLLLLLLASVIMALVREEWGTSVFALSFLMFLIYKGLIRLKIHAKSVVVRDGKVDYYIPKTTVRNRFDFIVHGQTIVQLPVYGLLDRAFNLEIFSPYLKEGVCACRLSLRFGYLMQPAAWQRAYDTYLEHHEELPAAIRNHLVKSCDRIDLKPIVAVNGVAAQEQLEPIVAELNNELADFGLEVVDVTYSFSEGSILARFVTAEQDVIGSGLPENVFSWQVKGKEDPEAEKWALLAVSGENLI